MGLLKSIKDLRNLTKQAKGLQEQQLAEQGYRPGLRGTVAQMGDLVGQASTQLAEFTQQSGDQSRILAEGVAGEAVIVAMGTPARGAQHFNLDLDLEVRIAGREPYRVANMYMVPASAPIGQGVTLPVKVDPADPAKVAIDWDAVAGAPARGEVRPAGAAAVGAAADEDPLDELERLVRLRDAGALTDAEFEQQKARILGG